MIRSYKKAFSKSILCYHYAPNSETTKLNPTIETHMRLAQIGDLVSCSYLSWLSAVLRDLIDPMSNDVHVLHKKNQVRYTVLC